VSAFSLTGRRALVTGANTGIGQAIAWAMARAGAEVICAARGDCSETLASLPNGRSVALDLSDPLAAGGLFRGAGIDILVNNAGTIHRADAVEVEAEDWDRVIDLNLKSVYFTSQAFARERMALGLGGAVVNIASLLSFQGGIRVPAYTASKHAVAGVTKALANEWAGKGLNVNAIAPGYIVTNNTAALRADADRSQSILDRIPAGRWGKADDIGEAAVFLSSPAAHYIHGVVLPVDGGWLAR
jgi:2-dehydro-3-deoxy-D-gluconate 5-dehydrogenase